ncbi:MAG: hypothetical protein U0353_14055 [Sandaracinus sp.]
MAFPHRGNETLAGSALGGSSVAGSSVAGSSVAGSSLGGSSRGGSSLGGSAGSGGTREARLLRPRTLRPEDRPRARQRTMESRSARFDSARALVLTPLDEARALEALAFSELPLATVLELEVPGWSGPVWIRSVAGRGPSVGPLTDPVIDGPAWRALAIAVASDRVRPTDFRALVAALAASPAEEREGAALREIAAWMDDIAPSPCRLRVGQVIERLGAKLFSVRIEESHDEHAANGPPIAWAG